MTSPFRLQIEAAGVVVVEKLKQNAAINHQRTPRYEFIVQQMPHGRKLAVCGGDPRLVDSLEELRAWDGDIWGINYTAQWLAERGIRSTMVTCDPLEFRDMPGVRDALVASLCSPGLVEQLAFRNLRLFDMCETHEQGIPGGITTATRTPALALRLGYLDVSYFGCGGSYEGDRDHVDRHEPQPQEVMVRAGGKDYRIEVGLLLQCEEFVKLFAVYGRLFKNRSGGLLAAMIENPDTWEVVGVSPALKAHLEAVNGKHGLYDTVYQPLQEAA